MDAYLSRLHLTSCTTQDKNYICSSTILLKKIEHLQLYFQHTHNIIFQQSSKETYADPAGPLKFKVLLYTQKNLDFGSSYFLYILQNRI